MLWLQGKGCAETPADLRQLLRDEVLADSDVRAFSDSVLQRLLDKGLTTPGMPGQGTYGRAARATSHSLLPG